MEMYVMNPMHKPQSHRSRGFTLIELMITLLIGSILLTIAVAGYGSQIRKSRRTEAKTALLDLAGRQEQFFSTNNTYAGTMDLLGYGTDAVTFLSVGSGYYQAKIVSSSPTAFTVAAVPVGGQLADSKCQYFSVDNTGKQSSGDNTNGAGNDTTPTCWN